MQLYLLKEYCFGPPFRTFGTTDPKIFLKAPLAPLNTNIEGERAPKKKDLFVKIFQKVPKNGFLTCFFKNLPAAQKIWPKQGLFTALEELGKSIWST